MTVEQKTDYEHVQFVVRLNDLEEIGHRLNEERGQCLDRVGLLISVGKSLGRDQLEAAKAGSVGISYDMEKLFQGIENELVYARLRTQALEECKAEMRDLWKVKRASRDLRR